jgi:16S rRNA (guanine(966)-N(2))-methyltransferase RsmD
MRIISGKYRGLNLAEFKGDDIRPTADRVKESLFNIIYTKVANSCVLDACCGSGNLGMECLSRGAKYVHFNDISRASIDVLKKNLAKLKGGEEYLITVSDYLTCLKSTKLKYDLIFLDPPYRFDFGETALKTIKERELLLDGGLVIYEWDKPLNINVDGVEKTDERKYGKTYLNFFEVTHK